MGSWTIVLPLIPVAVVAAVLWDARAKRTRRAAYLKSHPSLKTLQTTIDAAKYRTIRDSHGRTGEVQAARAIMRDYPGIKVAEAAELARRL